MNEGIHQCLGRKHQWLSDIEFSGTQPLCVPENWLGLFDLQVGPGVVADVVEGVLSIDGRG